MNTELIHIGFGNIMAVNRVIAIVSPKSAPTKRLIQEAKAKGLLIDMTSGRKTKAVLIISFLPSSVSRFEKKKSNAEPSPIPKIGIIIPRVVRNISRTP